MWETMGLLREQWITRRCKLCGDKYGGKKDNPPNKRTQLLQELLVIRQLVIS